MYEYITEKKSITIALNDTLGHAYNLHESGVTITKIEINLEEGKIYIHGEATESGVE